MARENGRRIFDWMQMTNDARAKKAAQAAQAAGVEPLRPAFGACLGSSMGFMRPVSTPPNAIVYGSGCIPLRTMIRCGFTLDLVGSALVIAAVLGLVPLVLR